MLSLVRRGQMPPGHTQKTRKEEVTMKLPNEVVEAMKQFASSYEPAQKAWFDRNLGYVMSKVEYIQTTATWACSIYSVEDNNIFITSSNRGVESSVNGLAETVWHEYAHLIYENSYVGGFQRRLERELEPYIKGIGSSRTYFEWRKVLGSAYNCPVMVSDAIGIIIGVEPPHYAGHPAGYPIENLETEVFAEYFAYVMTNNGKMLRSFKDMCPKTARILNKQVSRLFR